MLEKLTSLVRENTVDEAKHLVPMPAFYVNETAAWREAIRTALEQAATKGETKYELVFATTTTALYPGLPSVKWNKAVCDSVEDFSADQLFAVEKLTTKSNTELCQQCNTKHVRAKLYPARDDRGRNVLKNLFGFEKFLFTSCSRDDCFEQAVAKAKEWLVHELTAASYRLERYFDENWFVHPCCPYGLPEWLYRYTDIEFADNTNNITRRLALLRVGEMLHEYLDQLFTMDWLAFNVPVTFQRTRDSSTVEYGLFFDWSPAAIAAGEPVSKKTKTTE